eukprot:TRINITY_DN7930_c0_g1_i1.p1 TRINITY_DN7930_c0_g1~~TRINITY_DN7930_c0_g1_i1.p1  ORF type:complete len:170 (+),score=11.20 TRINITY_DN7930_c0_g1_i1:201-710(+)
MGTWKSLWFVTKKLLTGALIGVTISDRYASIVSVHGLSMHPTFTPSFSGSSTRKGDLVLVEKFCLEKYKFSHGDVIIFRSPSNHKETFMKRLIALPGDWISIPQSFEIQKIPEGHCWVEGDNPACSLDSRYFGPIPLGLIQGRVTHIIWPLARACKVERRVPENRISSF